MSLHFDEPELEGELTAIVFRLGDEHGETIFRVPADVQTIPFDQEDCDLLLTWSNEDSFVFTPFFVVIETTAHPEGELGARLHVIAEQPTLERGWGEVKSLYVEAP
jgi:hypothetical protein